MESKITSFIKKDVQKLVWHEDNCTELAFLSTQILVEVKPEVLFERQFRDLLHFDFPGRSKTLGDFSIELVKPFQKHFPVRVPFQDLAFLFVFSLLPFRK